MPYFSEIMIFFYLLLHPFLMTCNLNLMFSWEFRYCWDLDKTGS